MSAYTDWFASDPSSSSIGALVNFGGAEHECGLLAQTEDGILELHEISDVGGAEKGCGKRCRFRFSSASI
jgi:hypothetical protein